MSNFANSFWSADYAGGLGVLFGKLQQGVQENKQLLTITRMRADAEDLYGQHIGDIGPTVDQIPDGFSKDDGASVRKAYDGVRTEMLEAGKKHRKIASNIRELVVYPFSRWCEQHATRVQNSQDELQARMKAHDRQSDLVRKYRSQYYNKYRLVEDLEEEDKLAFKDPQGDQSPQQTSRTPTVRIQTPDEVEDQEPLQIGDAIYQPEQVKRILTHALETIHLGETKVPILGTYQNISTGAEIVEYIQKHMNGSSVSYAERIGQDLITHGYLRLVGNVGSVFANSSRMNYQWRPKAFQLTGIPEKKRALDRSGTTLSLDSVESPLVGSVAEYLSGWNPLNNQYANETPATRLQREAREADERYRTAVRKLDQLRCVLEEVIIEHLRFMEQCELDRLKAIKAVILDFSGAISNVIPSLQSTVDNMMLFQETVQPLGDLRYLLENYRTGTFVPKVQIYENYYNSVDDQTFGVDLEARARSDKKRVPIIVSSILTYLDNHYPILESDEPRRAIWLVDVPLAQTHKLRAQLNNGLPVPNEVLESFEVHVVASVLKLYLMELPDSLVSSGFYEIIKAIYTTPETADPGASDTRISVLQNTLSQLRLANIATLDAIATHFTRLIDLTSADEEYVVKLSQTLAPCILRARNESSLSFEEKYNYRFLRDLLAHKEAIFAELKRASTMSRSVSVMRANSDEDGTGRPRAISTDESNRRANMEERNRAIVSRSRASSPAPNKHDPQRAMHHRRESSRITPSETRFPVHATTSPTSTRLASSSARKSLDVPGTPEPAAPLSSSALPTAETPQLSTTWYNGQMSPDREVPPTLHTNGHAASGSSAEEDMRATADISTVAGLPGAFGPASQSAQAADGLNGVDADPPASAGFIGRSSNARKSAGGRTSLDGMGISTGSTAVDEQKQQRPIGVELVDRPMDD